MDDLKERLRTMADMIGLCEKISWGQDSAIMREAAARIEDLESENARLRLVAHYARDVADAAIENTREAEAKLATARNDALEEAAEAAEAWYRNLGKGMPHDEVRALKSTNQT